MHPRHAFTLAAGLFAPSVPALASGDADAGRALYQSRCAACHALDYNGVGPAHRGAFGRPAAQAQGFAYSDVLKASQLVWNEETLNRWLADPESLAPGQRIGVSVADAQERSDLIAYLKQVSSRPK
jgi:cytochrome c